MIFASRVMDLTINDICKSCYGFNHHTDLTVQCHESTVYIDMLTTRTFSKALSKNVKGQLQFWFWWTDLTVLFRWIQLFNLFQQYIGDLDLLYKYWLSKTLISGFRSETT